MLRQLYQDLKRNYRPERNLISNLGRSSFHPDFLVVFLYRTASTLYKLRLPVLPRIVWLLVRIVFCCDIDFRCEIMEGCLLRHALGIVIGKDVRIGAGVTIYQQTTLGGNLGKLRELDGRVVSQPVIEDGVVILPGAKVLGPVHIGRAAIIGSNAVVTRDVPSDCIAVGQNQISPLKDVAFHRYNSASGEKNAQS